MSKVCQLTGKRPIVGNSVSHSNRKTKRRFEPNLQRKRFFVPETGEWVTLRITTQAMRTIDKKGVYQFIKEQQAKGFGLDIELGATGC
jgi:large subunit ribosomal protein L28